MSTSALISAVLEMPSTATLRVNLAVRGVLQDFAGLSPADEPAVIDWSRALSRASVLTSADDVVAQDVALRIAQGCLVADDALPHHRDAATILLERLGNQPSLQLAVDRNRIEPDGWAQAPGPLQLDVVRRRLELAIPIAGGEVIAGNPFQRRLWTAAEDASWVSVSAPTSAGKSYIVRRWFEDKMFDRETFTGVYLVPTRALIEEVSSDLRNQFADLEVGIYSLPWDAEITERARKILVVTQERLHLLQQRFPTQGADLGVAP